MIDLHMHTTASDGTCTPEELVERVRGVGIQIMSVTDHDTMAAVERATQAAAPYRITVVPGIEITSVHQGRDVHVLAYFLSEQAPGLQDLLQKQRRLRVDRAREIGDRLARLGVPIDMGSLIEGGANSGGKALARPQIARALVAAGHVASVAEAFDRYLSNDGPAYVPHQGASPATVSELVARVGGLASLAHPGQLNRDEIIPDLVASGLAAIEAYHSSHTPDMEAHYLDVAGRFGLAVTGGSDYHGEGTRRAEFFGVTALPQEHFDTLAGRCALR